nr:hypothetical protein [Tanacetum cinerariifolium]
DDQGDKDDLEVGDNLWEDFRFVNDEEEVDRIEVDDSLTMNLSNNRFSHRFLVLSLSYRRRRVSCVSSCFAQVRVETVLSLKLVNMMSDLNLPTDDQGDKDDLEVGDNLWEDFRFVNDEEEVDRIEVDDSLTV